MKFSSDLPKTNTIFTLLLLGLILIMFLKLFVNVVPARNELLYPINRALFNPKNEDKKSLMVEKLLKDLNKKKLRHGALRRNLFEEWTAPPMQDVLLRIESIQNEGPPVFYQGVMQDDDQSIIAQVNIEGKSYFLKAGESARGWQILSISPKELQVKDKEGQEIMFPYRGGAVRAKDVFAILIKEPEKRVYKVKEADIIDDFKVTQIGDGIVKLEKDGKEFLIRQGTSGLVIDRMEWDERSFLNESDEEQGSEDET